MGFKNSGVCWLNPSRMLVHWDFLIRKIKFHNLSNWVLWQISFISTLVVPRIINFPNKLMAVSFPWAAHHVTAWRLRVWGWVKIATAPVCTGKSFSQNFFFIRVQYLFAFIPMDGASFESVCPVLIRAFKRELSKYFFAQVGKFVNDPFIKFYFVVFNIYCGQDLRYVATNCFRCLQCRTPRIIPTFSFAFRWSFVCLSMYSVY